MVGVFFPFPLLPFSLLRVLTAVCVFVRFSPTLFRIVRVFFFFVLVSFLSPLLSIFSHLLSLIRWLLLFPFSGGQKGGKKITKNKKQKPTQKTKTKHQEKAQEKDKTKKPAQEPKNKNKGKDLEKHSKKAQQQGEMGGWFAPPPFFSPLSAMAPKKCPRWARSEKDKKTDGMPDGHKRTDGTPDGQNKKTDGTPDGHKKTDGKPDGQNKKTDGAPDGQEPFARPWCRRRTSLHAPELVLMLLRVVVLIGIVIGAPQAVLAAVVLHPKGGFHQCYVDRRSERHSWRSFRRHVAHRSIVRRRSRNGRVRASLRDCVETRQEILIRLLCGGVEPNPGMQQPLRLSQLEKNATEVIADKVYAIVAKRYPEDAAPVTSMVMEMEVTEIEALLMEPKLFMEKVDEAVRFIQYQTAPTEQSETKVRLPRPLKAPADPRRLLSKMTPPQEMQWRDARAIIDEAIHGDIITGYVRTRGTDFAPFIRVVESASTEGGQGITWTRQLHSAEEVFVTPYKGFIYANVQRWKPNLNGSPSDTEEEVDSTPKTARQKKNKNKEEEKTRKKHRAESSSTRSAPTEHKKKKFTG